ncbi:proteoglycan 4 isoform X2 [Pseudomyrmex gracilis]|uniref:proteoglycan 4 isoform X2 n=1 Tax=Pseudomyrmex gracilis TaxID=219809 RepID=UPI00099597B9|nr:proteoglycan 4 isoform X2 [Pseudomyrmex gracilis]
MSTQCNRFVQNAWKKELCSNCFKPKEEHVTADDVLRLNVEKASTNLKINRLQLQSILRGKAICRKDQRKKNVGFPESLTEIIGYGGEDFSDGEEDKDGSTDSSMKPEDLVPDSEEERALFDLTRANTNFNTITANLTELESNGNTTDSTKSSTTTTAKSFASLMLGKIQKDADGRKTTLLVSVTPFGGDESVPTAKRPVDRKINAVNSQPSPFRLKSDEGSSSDHIDVKKLNGTERKKISEQEQKSSSSELGKIVDMPLIPSANMIAVIRKESSTPNSVITSAEKKLEMTTHKYSLNCDGNKKNPVPVNGVLTTRKTEVEMSRIPARSGSNNNDVGESDCANRTVTSKNGECFSQNDKTDEGIELTLTSLKNEKTFESNDRSVNTGEKNAAKPVDNSKNITSPRQIECTEIIEEKKFCFEISRELAGEPDGKADEAEITEPPALPNSPPPVVTTEPRPSFLHGNVNNDPKAKPAVPQKPVILSATKTISNPKTSPVVVERISDYVPPPPSVQNVAGRSVQNSVAKEAESRQHSTETNVSNEAPLEADQTFPTQNVESENQRKMLARSSFLPLSASLSATLVPTRDRSTENGEIDEDVSPDEEFPEIAPVSVSTMELVRSPNKRRMAPRPPEEDLPVSSLFARNPGASNLKSDSPVVREKEKRERSSSCSPKFRKAVSDVPDPTNSTNKQPVESTARRTISLSQDSLTTEKEVRGEKKRSRNRKGFSLKRFLRMGSRKDMDMMTGQTSGAKTDEIPSTPQPKPRLEIIHPLELDGAAVEVVGSDRITAKVGDDQTDSGAKNDGSKMTRFPSSSTTRPGKPPPPPRNQSLEDWSKTDSANKPVRPPPPRAELNKLNVASSRSDKMSSKTTWRPTTATTSDSIYANLGEVRSALAPSKPQRTASMRDRAVFQPVPKRTHSATSENQYQDYDATVRRTSDSPTSNDSHVYECLSSSPECDSNIELRHGGGGRFRTACKRKSDSSAMGGDGGEKHHHHHHHHHQHSFVRSISLPYCGSETESELYASYSFYTGDEGAEEDQDWKNRDDEPKMGRLRQRRGRTVVHRSLEDNYGAVVVANHEALAQFVEQTIQLPSGLRGLKNTNPQLKHFNIDASASISVGRRLFCPATWNDQNVTLCIAFDIAVPMPQRDFYLTPVIEFVDTVPKKIIEKVRPSRNENAEATISVLTCSHVTTIQLFGDMLKNINNESANKEASFVLLQLVNALKSLQARGIEYASKSLNDVVLCREDVYYRLYLLQGRLNIDPSDEPSEERVSLCECALLALQQMHLANEFPLIRDLLIREKAVTLSQVKSVLEFVLWGPADVPLGGPREREVALQRWLDLERANVLHALVKTKVALTVIDEYQLLFLVRTTGKIMSEASMLLDEHRNRSAHKY